MTMLVIPGSWTEPSYTKYCDPTALKGAGSGSGTSNSPYTDLQAALDALSASDVLGIRTGRTLDVSSHVNMANTTNIYSLASLDDITIAAWMPSGAPATPSVFQTAKLIGTLTTDWEEVDYKPNGSPGDVVATSGVFTLLVGSGVWHYKGTIGSAVSINGLGFGSRDSISSIVTPSTYKSHSYRSAHTEVGWLNDSGSNAIIANSTAQRTAFVADMQWNQTTNGGLLVKSPTNPATRWGGVYAYHASCALLSVLDCDQFSLQYPFEAQYVGRIARIRNDADRSIAGEWIGYGGEDISELWSISTDNTNPIGGVNDGSVSMSAGTNTDVFGDGTEPWLSIDMSHIRVNRLYGNGGITGWIRDSAWHDMQVSMANLQSGGAILTIDAYATLGHRNQIYDFDLSRIHCGAGRFGRSDWGPDAGETTTNFYFHSGVLSDSAGSIQLGGSRRNLGIYNCRFARVVKGPHCSDERDDGNTSRQIAGVSVILSDPSGWDLSTFAGSTGTDWTKALALNMEADMGYPAKGHRDDTDTMTHNDGVLVDNFRWKLGDCPAASGYGLRNATINDAHTAKGPWDDTDNDGVAENGEPVTSGQTQVLAQVLATVGKFASDPNSTSTKRIVDKNYSDASATQTVTTHTTTDPLETADGFLTDASPSAYRTGGTVLNATTIDTVIDYTRVATNVKDRRGIPRYNASLGDVQWIALSSTTRALF